MQIIEAINMGCRKYCRLLRAHNLWYAAKPKRNLSLSKRGVINTTYKAYRTVGVAQDTNVNRGIIQNCIKRQVYGPITPRGEVIASRRYTFALINIWKLHRKFVATVVSALCSSPPSRAIRPVHLGHFDIDFSRPSFRPFRDRAPRVVTKNVPN